MLGTVGLTPSRGGFFPPEIATQATPQKTKRSNMLIIGITGNIGSGKTTVSKILEAEGAYTINADQIARDVLAKDGAGYAETVGFFGESILQDDGNINRLQLANIVFNDKSKLAKLNETTHKHVLAKIDELIAKVRETNSHKLTCLDVPLLFESGLDKICDTTWLIDATYETKLTRVIARDKTDRDSAKSRLDNQTPSSELRKKCDTVIENDKGIEELEKQVNIELSALLRRQ